MKLKRKRKPRISFKVSHFNGTMHTYETSKFHIITYCRRKKEIEMSNSIGSFISYLTREKAVSVAVKRQRAAIVHEQKILERIEALR